jgi:hypothetical protein
MLSSVGREARPGGLSMAIDGWRIQGFHGGFWLVRGRRPAPPGGELLSAESASGRLDGWFPEGREEAGARATLMAICREIDEPCPAGPPPPMRWLKESVRRAIRDGRLSALRSRIAVTDQEVEEKAVAPLPPAKKRAGATWIEISLRDDHDPPRPMPYRRYRIETTDGMVREGRLDANGKARVEGIDPGNCDITFPEFHGDDWKRA